MSEDLCDRSATELLSLMATGECSSVEVVQAHLQRIEHLNGTLNAIVTLVPEVALELAQAADTARQRGDRLGALHGLPVGIKDLVDTAGIRTTYGSPIYAGNVPVRDATVVTRLKSAGAIVLGKTNTPEFGAGSHTFNAVFGATLNPYDQTKSAGGSSGGAAVALATGMLPLADGTDLGGSLRNPASFCNVVGLRPSPGLVTSLPTGDLWDPASVAGPLGRNVRDVAAALDVMSEPDPRAPLSAGRPAESYQSVIGESVAGQKIAWSRDLGGLPLEAEVARVLAPQREIFEQLGCTVEDAEPDLSGADEAFDVLRAVGFLASHHAKLLSHRGLLKDTVIWNIEAGLQLTPLRIAEALTLRSAIVQRTVAFFEEFDALVLPVSQVAPFPIEYDWVREVEGQAMEHYVAWQRSCSRISVTSHPAISVPAGFTSSGLPVGIQIVGRFRDERGLLRIASAFEAETRVGARRPKLLTDASIEPPGLR
jgi:amidase